VVTSDQAFVTSCLGAWQVVRSNAEPRRAILMYLAVYACGYNGRGNLDQYLQLNRAIFDSAYIEWLGSVVLDRQSITGWHVQRWDSDTVYGTFQGIRACWPAKLQSSQNLKTGQIHSLELPVIFPGQLPGFVYRHGESQNSSEQVSRIYLNISSHQAAWVLNELARSMNEARLPYSLKVLAHPRAFKRRDSAVVYVPTKNLEVTLDHICEQISRDRMQLQNGCPLFTCEVQLGISWADDPDDVAPGQSHGQWTSSIFLNAARSSKNSVSIRKNVISLIEQSGRDPDKPYKRG
jgi:HopA1 effector protein family